MAKFAVNFFTSLSPDKRNSRKNFTNLAISHYTIIVKISVTFFLSFLFHFCKELLNLITIPVGTNLKAQRRTFLSSPCL